MSGRETGNCANAQDGCWTGRTGFDTIKASKSKRRNAHDFWTKAADAAPAGWHEPGRIGGADGVSRQAVSRWERDETMPDPDKIVVLADLFGVTTDYLLGRSDARG